MEKRFKFRHVNQVTGLFVLAVVALVVATVVFSGHSQRWFAHKYAFDVLLPEAGAFGLRRGDEVFISGVSVGWVDDVLPIDDGRMKARLKVRGDFGRFVRVDSTAATILRSHREKSRHGDCIAPTRLRGLRSRR